MSEHTKMTQNSLTPVAQKFILHWGEMGTRWSLRELQGWRIVRVVHVLGDRRDHFESIKDVWEIFRIVSEERKRREIDPTLRVLAECVHEVKTDPKGDAYARERLETMLEFLTAMTGLFEEIIRMPTGALKGVVKLRGKVITLLGTEKKKAAV
jgi:DNA-binding transcriptional regulator GbsR (MarR family)